MLFCISKVKEIGERNKLMSEKLIKIKNIDLNKFLVQITINSISLNHFLLMLKLFLEEKK